MQAELVIQKIKNAIAGTPYSGRTYIVGGYVRDKILGRKGEDIDIVVNLPDGGIKLAKYLHEINICSAPVIYKNFGTALISVDGKKIELVMTRSENYRAENRKPEVQTASLKEDIQRRDFTVNTLLLDMVSGQMLDLSGYALSDIKSGIIRTTSDPDTTFKDDPLRMLRAVRFAGQLNFEIEENTKDAILRNCEALNFISWQRKRDELSNMLLQKNPEKALNYLIKLNLMSFVIPELLPLIGMQQGKQHENDVWQHTLKVITSTRPKLELRLAALLHDVGKPQTKVFNNSGIHFYGHEAESRRMALQILKRLNYSSALTNRISKVIFHHMRLKQAGAKSEIISDKAIRKLILQLGENLNLLLDLVHADNLNHAPDFRLPQQIPNLKKRIKKMAKDFSINNLPINGRDIIYLLKIDSGERVGKLLDEAKEIWLENPQITKDEILSNLERRQKMESKISEKVKEGVVKAVHAGEDVIKAVGNITKEVISTTKDSDLDTKEKAQKLAKEAFEGAKEGYQQAKPPVKDFTKKAAKIISENFKTYAPKVAHFTKDVLEGIFDGAKEVIDEQKKKKEEKKSCCKNKD